MPAPCQVAWPQRVYIPPRMIRVACRTHSVGWTPTRTTYPMIRRRHPMMPHAVATPSLLQQQAKRFTLADGKSTRIVYYPQAPVSGPVRPPEGPQVEYDGPEGPCTF